MSLFRNVSGEEVRSRVAASQRVGEQLRRVREDAGVSLATLAARSHFSREYLCNVEKGRRAATLDSYQCYSAAQMASNAATAYVSLAFPEKVREYADLAFPVITEAGSAWSQSLVLLDLAVSQALSTDADLDGAAHLVIEVIGGH